MKLLMLCLFYALPLYAEECQLAIVEWQDAVIHTRESEIHDNLLAPAISFGCVQTIKGVIVVIHSFSNGHPSDYLAIPSKWATKITPLQKVEEKKKKPTKVPVSLDQKWRQFLLQESIP